MATCLINILLLFYDCDIVRQLGKLHDSVKCDSMSQHVTSSHIMSKQYAITIVCRLGRLHDSVKCFTLCLQLDSFFIDGLICRGNAFMDFGNELALTMAR